MTTKILGTLFAALFSPVALLVFAAALIVMAPIALLVFAAALIVMAPIAPFYIVFYVVRKELRLRRERKQREEAARAFVKAVVAMRSADLSQFDPTNN